jgi:hypothetical protein
MSNGPDGPKETRRPMGVSLPNARAASVSLTIATLGADASSATEKSRPTRTGRASAAKYPGVTKLWLTIHGFCRFVFSRFFMPRGGGGGGGPHGMGLLSGTLLIPSTRRGHD